MREKVGLIAVFGKMKAYTRLLPGQKQEDIKIKYGDVEIALPYQGQVAGPEMSNGKILNVAPVHGVLAFDDIRYTPGSPLPTIEEKAIVLREVAVNVKNRLYECTVKFFDGDTEITPDDVLRLADRILNHEEEEENADAHGPVVSGSNSKEGEEENQPGAPELAQGGDSKPEDTQTS